MMTHHVVHESFKNNNIAQGGHPVFRGANGPLSPPPPPLNATLLIQINHSHNNSLDTYLLCIVQIQSYSTAQR